MQQTGVCWQVRNRTPPRSIPLSSSPGERSRNPLNLRSSPSNCFWFLVLLLSEGRRNVDEGCPQSPPSPQIPVRTSSTLSLTESLYWEVELRPHTPAQGQQTKENHPKPAWHSASPTAQPPGIQPSIHTSHPYPPPPLPKPARTTHPQRSPALLKPQITHQK